MSYCSGCVIVTSMGETRITQFRGIVNTLEVSFANTLPSDAVTVNLNPLENVVGGTTIQKMADCSLSAFSSIGVSQESVMDDPAPWDRAIFGSVSMVGRREPSPDRRSPLLPSSLMEETDTPAP